MATGALISGTICQSFATSSSSVCLDSPSFSGRSSSYSSCLPPLCVCGRFSTWNSARTCRLIYRSGIGRRKLEQKLACARKPLPSRHRPGGPFGGDNDERGLASLLPLLSQMFPSKRSLSSKAGQDEDLRVFGMAKHKGRVGTYKREGNVSMALFGIKLKRKVGEKVDISTTLTKMLPFIVAATAALALTQPASFAWVRKDYYAPALGGIMLSIGIQLSVEDFAVVLKRPLSVVIGSIAQYVVKPLLGLMLVKLFFVPAAFSSGLLLTSCVSGAQLSTYASFLSEGNVALSIVLTSLTTIASVVMTPFLTRLFIGSVVPVDVFAMATSILQVVIAPIFLGLALNTYARPVVDKLRSVLPVIAMCCTSLCIGSPLALNSARILSPEGLQLMGPVVAFHIGAFVLGYWISRIPFWRQEDKESRTISLCTGMQSSTLAMLLASQFLGQSHAVPPACSVVVMALVGLSLASFWGKGYRIRDIFVDFCTICNRALGQSGNLELCDGY